MGGGVDDQDHFTLVGGEWNGLSLWGVGAEFVEGVGHKLQRYYLL